VLQHGGHTVPHVTEVQDKKWLMAVHKQEFTYACCSMVAVAGIHAHGK
jgi:hypothetical protein